MRLKGLADIKTTQKVKIHSMSLKKTSKYLKLYTLGMEKHRLQQYKAVIDKTKQRADASLEDVQREMGEIASSVAEEERGNEETRKRTPNKRMKTMTLDY